MIKDTELFLSEAFIEAAIIRAAKRKDYGGDLKDYFPFDGKSYCHELHKKTKRLVNLEKTEVIPIHESVIDNLLDLINYASFYYEYLMKGETDDFYTNIRGDGSESQLGHTKPRKRNP